VNKSALCMKIIFEKYHGTGNDFIMIDGRGPGFRIPDRNVIARLCQRHFGIGADGLIIIQDSDQQDFRMRYFNSDGREGTFCGNGGRCAVDFYSKQNKEAGQSTVFEASDGIHKAVIPVPDFVQLELNDVDGIQVFEDHFELDTGSPHYVKFVNQVDELDVQKMGAEIRYSEPFNPEGINVNFVKITRNELYVRTYERGVERETLSCGTGVVASAISASIKSGTDKKSFLINTRGGPLEVSFERSGEKRFKNIILSGPVAFVFFGEAEID